MVPWAVLVALVGPVVTPPAVATGGVPVPERGVYLGSWVKPLGGIYKREALVARERQIGRTFAIDHQYYRWDSVIPTSYESWTADAGRIPFLSWNARRSNGTVVPWSRIASGAEDAWISARADAFRTFARPVYLSFHHEPENDVPTFGQPSDYVAAFRRIVDIFRARNATNVTFVWTMMAWSFERQASVASQYYPGDAYVDVVAADGYNWYPGRKNARWRSFREVMASTRAFAMAHGKPFMAAEFGVQEDPARPGRKGDWYREILSVIPEWPELIALVYFDSDRIYPWMPDTSASALAGYRDLASDPATAASLAGVGTDALAQQVSAQDILRRNSFDGGAVGASLTVAGSGGTSGDAFDALALLGSAQLVYDGREVVSGLAARHVIGPKESASYVWNVSIPGDQRWWGRLYVRTETNPSGRIRLIRARSAGVLRLAVDLTRDGSVRVVDADGEPLLVTGVALPSRTWIRLEWAVDPTTGGVELALFDGSTDVALARASGASSSLMGAGLDQVRLGGQAGGSVTEFTFWTDEPALSLSGWIGP
ncbi:Endoglucanase H [bacterium HR12]|nr:Endoglucanase H [bacterium HR12]